VSSYLENLSDLERQEFLATAQIARRLKREQGINYAHANLKLDWDEEPYWKELSSYFGVRRFQWYEQADVKRMRKAVKKSGRDSTWFTDVFGFSKYEEHLKANPKMTANAFLGFCLEQVNEEMHSS
jgi:hypothetical protein